MPIAVVAQDGVIAKRIAKNGDAIERGRGGRMIKSEERRVAGPEPKWVGWGREGDLDVRGRVDQLSKRPRRGGMRRRPEGRARGRSAVRQHVGASLGEAAAPAKKLNDSSLLYSSGHETTIAKYAGRDQARRRLASIEPVGQVCPVGPQVLSGWLRPRGVGRGRTALWGAARGGAAARRKGARSACVGRRDVRSGGKREALREPAARRVLAG